MRRGFPVYKRPVGDISICSDIEHPIRAIILHMGISNFHDGVVYKPMAGLRDRLLRVSKGLLRQPNTMGDQYCP